MNDDDTVADVLEWLGREVRHESGPVGKIVVLRRFLEATNSALQELLGVSTLVIDAWEAKIIEKAKALGRAPIHAKKYVRLGPIYADANIEAHPNRESARLDVERCHRYLRDIEELFPQLVGDMHALGLEMCAEIRRQLKQAHHLRRAQLLIDAVIAMCDADEARLGSEMWPVIVEFLESIDPQAVGYLSKSPSYKSRVERAIRHSLIKGCQPDDRCALVRFAQRFQTDHLKRWLDDDLVQRLQLRSSPRLLPVLRIELRPPEEITPYVECDSSYQLKTLTELFDEDPWEIRGPFHYWDDGGNPISVCEAQSLVVSSPAELSSALWKCVNEALKELDLRRLARGAVKAGSLVLWLSVRGDLVHYDWEGLEVLKPPSRFSLAQRVGAIVIEALGDEHRPLAPDPVRHEDTVVYATPEHARQHPNQAAPIAVALPAAWDAASPNIATPFPVAPEGLINRSVLVQVIDTTAEAALGTLQIVEGDTRRLEDLISFIGQRKRSNDETLRKPGAYRIICLDSRYVPPNART